MTVLGDAIVDEMIRRARTHLAELIAEGHSGSEPRDPVEADRMDVAIHVAIPAALEVLTEQFHLTLK
jgi:hypothetical protein